jgi:hypothetical protein
VAIGDRGVAGFDRPVRSRQEPHGDHHASSSLTNDHVGCRTTRRESVSSERKQAAEPVEIVADVEPLPHRADAWIDPNHVASLVREAANVPTADLRGRSGTTDAAGAGKALALITADHRETSADDAARFLHEHPRSVSLWLEAPQGSLERPELVSSFLTH